MSVPKYKLAEALYEELSGLPPEQRTPALALRCDGDDQLRAMVERLLVDDDSDMAGFLSAPILSPERFARGIPAQIGKYLIVREIGRGGAGVVYEACQNDPPRRVALKVIGAGFASVELRRRFGREAEFLGHLQHPGIAQVYEVGVAELGSSLGVSAALPYFAMELVHGEPVTQYCDRKRLSIRQRLSLFRDICDAVQHAHQKGIIHRDLKPSNVLVTEASGRPMPKVIDFGIAKATVAMGDVERTELHQLVGTPEYMSPEQVALSADVDTRSDVYSLGVLLYELLTGTTPLEGPRLRETSFAQVQRLIGTVEPASPSARAGTFGANGRAEAKALAAALRGDLDWIVMKCLEKDRARRYDTASALATDIQRHLDHQPVLASPPSLRYRLLKFVRRNRGAVAAASAVAAALVLGAIGSALGLAWAVQEQFRAEEQRAIAQREAEQARAVNAFMREVLTSVEPQNRGADVRLFDVLGAASATASQRFADHPLLEAQVRDLLGDVYISLSLWHQSDAEYSQALALWRVHAGADDPRALSSELRHVGALLNMPQTREAEAVLAALLPRLEAVLGRDDLRTLEARRCAAIIHSLRGRPEESIRILLELRTHPALVDEGRMQVQILHSLFNAYRARPTIEDRAERLAFWEQIAPLGQEWVERAMGLHGPDSMVTLLAQVKLAEIAYEQEQFEAAAQVCRELLQRQTTRLGECHMVCHAARTTLALALARLGGTSEPAELYLRAIECARQTQPGSTLLLVTMSDALRYLDRGERAVEGEALAREVSADMRKYAGGHAEAAFDAEVYLAGFLSMQGRFDEAEAAFHALSGPEPSAMPARSRARLRLIRAAHLRRLGHFDQAEQQLREVVAIVQDIRLGTWDDLPDDIILGFVELYHAWGKPAEHEQYRRLREEPGPQ